MRPQLCISSLGGSLSHSVSQGNDVNTEPHGESSLYRQTLPVSKWLVLLKKMNTRYVVNGSRLQQDRWKDAEGDSTSGLSL